MSKPLEIARAVAACGGRATREDIATATSFEGRVLEGAIYIAIKKFSFVKRDGKEFVLTPAGTRALNAEPGAASTKPKPTKQAPKAARFDVNAPEPAPPKSPGRPRHATPEPIPGTGALIAINGTGTVEAHMLFSGGAIITESDIVLHRLSPAAVAAILNATRS